MAKKSFHICESERQLLDLTGEGSELVRITMNPEQNGYYLNGFFLFLREKDKGNSFIRQQPTDIIIVNKITCPTKYLQFDKKMGIIPDTLHYSYTSPGPAANGYKELSDKLKAIDEWRSNPIRPSSGSVLLLSTARNARNGKVRPDHYKNDSAW